MSDGNALDPIAVSSIIVGHLADAIDALKESHPHVLGTLSVLLEVEQNRLRQFGNRSRNSCD